MKKKITSIIITLAALILLAASMFFQCAAMEDGTYMNCHKANITVAVLSGVIAIAGILSFIVKETIKKLVLLGITAVLSVINAVVPGVVISLCMMPEMTCRAVLRPVTILCSLIICLSAIAGFLLKERVHK
jgi:hypothetical protein